MDGLGGYGKHGEDVKKMETIKCGACGKKHNGTKTQWWHLKGYFGLTGFVCSNCFEKVAHRDGKPIHPVAYRNVLKMLTPPNC